MNLKQVLDDEKTFADGIEITINNEKVTLGDLRGLSRAKQEELSARMADTERKRTEVLVLAETAAKIKDQLETQLAEASKRAAVPDPVTADFEKDPFWEPVRKSLSGPQAEIKALREELKKVQSVAENVTKIWAEDRWQSQYREGKSRLKDKAKDWTYEKVRDYAGEHRLLDNHGLPSVERAIAELTKEDELQAAITKAREEGLREGMTRGRMGVQPRPTSASGPPKPEKSAVAEKGLEALGDDVAQDPELMQMLTDLGAIDPNDLVQ